MEMFLTNENRANKRLQTEYLSFDHLNDLSYGQRKIITFNAIKNRIESKSLVEVLSFWLIEDSSSNKVEFRVCYSVWSWDM